MSLTLNYAGPSWARPGQDALEQMRSYFEQMYVDQDPEFDTTDTVLEIENVVCLGKNFGEGAPLIAYEVADETDPYSGGASLWCIPGPEGKCASEEDALACFRIALDAGMRPNFRL